MLGLILTIIIVGAIAGFVARLLVPGRQDLSVAGDDRARASSARSSAGLLGYLLFHKDADDGFLQPVRHHRLDHRRSHLPADLAVVAAAQRRPRLTDTPAPGPPTRRPRPRSRTSALCVDDSVHGVSLTPHAAGGHIREPRGGSEPLYCWQHGVRLTMEPSTAGL